MRKILFICALVMTLTTAYSQDRWIAPEKVNILQKIEEIYNKKYQRKIENQFKEFESKSKIRDTVRFIERGSTVTKMLFISMQTYASPLDTVIKIITNVKTFCNSSSFSMPLVEFDKAIMVIETVDNEIITLYSTSYKFDIEIIPPWVYTKNIFRHPNCIYRHLHYWNISVENINKLKSGVKKIKIKSKCGKGLYEKEFEKDKIGTILYDGFTHFIKVENIDALPITHDTLIALGFKEIMNSGWFIYKDNTIQYDLNSHALLLNLKDTYKNIQYFHELQQTLYNNGYEIDFQ